MSTFDASFVGPLDSGDSYTPFNLSDYIAAGTSTIVGAIGAANTVKAALSGQTVAPQQQRQDTANAGKSNNTMMWVIGAVILFVVLKK